MNEIIHEKLYYKNIQSGYIGNASTLQKNIYITIQRP